MKGLIKPDPDRTRICFYARDFAQDWHEWMPHQDARLEPGGLVVLGDGAGDPGIRSTAFGTAGPGLHTLRGRFTPSPGSEDAGWVVRLRHAWTHEPLGADTPIKGGVFELAFLMPQHFDTAEVMVLATAPRPEASGRLEHVRVYREDEAVWHESHQAKMEKPVIAYVTGAPARADALRDTVRSLALQCDEVRVLWSGDEAMPDFLNQPRVTILPPDADLSAEVYPPGYRIFCADHLLFPPDFVRRMTRKLGKQNDRAIVGLQGILIRQPLQYYPQPGSRHVTAASAGREDPVSAQLLSANAIALHSDLLDGTVFSTSTEAELALAIHAHDNKIPLIEIDRPANWVRENNTATPEATAPPASEAQTAALRALLPLSAPRLRRPMAVYILELSDPDQYHAEMDRFHATATTDYDWKIVVVAVTRNRRKRHRFDWLPFRNEFHLVLARNADEAATKLGALLPQLVFDYGVFKGAGVQLADGGWSKAAKAAGDAGLRLRMTSGRLMPAGDADRIDFATFTSANIFAQRGVADRKRIDKLTAQISAQKGQTPRRIWPPQDAAHPRQSRPFLRWFRWLR